MNDWRRLPVRIRYTDRPSESVHAMNNKIAFSNALISNLLNRLSETLQTTIGP